MDAPRISEGVVLLSEVPRFTPAQWQRLFFDAGLKECKVHLFVHDESRPNSPWSLVVDTGKGIVDVEAFSVPLPTSALDEAQAPDELAEAARGHGARIEMYALEGRCSRALAHELVGRVAAAILRTTYAIAWIHKANSLLLPAADCAQGVRECPPGRVPLHLFARLRQTPRPPAVVVDTIGLPTFDLPDLEIEVDAEEAPAASEFIAVLTSSLIEGSQSLREGEPVPGPLGVGWKPAVTKSAIPPFRAVMRFSLSG